MNRLDISCGCCEVDLEIKGLEEIRLENVEIGKVYLCTKANLSTRMRLKGNNIILRLW
jgi:hypothetical protein